MPITHKFDQLKMYFGEPFDVGNGITILQPTVGEILEIGEENFYGVLYTFISNPTTYRLQLWDMGIDWNKITQFELFMMLYRTIDTNVSRLLFKDVDFAGFDLYSKMIKVTNDDGVEEDKKVPVLFNKEQNIEISEDDFTLISEYLQVMFNIFPKVERAKGRSTKESIIEEDRLNLQFKQKQGEDNESGLLALVSSCVNHPGFKYKLQELRDVGICQFMDSVQRLQVYEASTALMAGIYSGFVDSSKIKAEDYNWMKSLSKKS